MKMERRATLRKAKQDLERVSPPPPLQPQTSGREGDVSDSSNESEDDK